MENVLRFPPRYPHPEHSWLGRAVNSLIGKPDIRNVPDLARHTGANPAIIDMLLDARVAYYGLEVKA
jgi:hypothetical protein